MTTDRTIWYLIQYHRKKQRARMIDKAWISGFAIAGSVLPDARFDIKLGGINGSEDIWLKADDKTCTYITETLLADVEKWKQRAFWWASGIGTNELLPHEDYLQKNWINHSVMLVQKQNIGWFAENDIEIIY